MSELFLKFLNISITAGWLVLGILIVRMVLKKAPKWMNCLMWGIVGLRLIFPFSIESIFSLIPSKETVSEEIFYAKYPTIQSGSTVVNNIVNPVLSTFFEATPQWSANPIQIAVFVAANVWVAGMIGMLGYAIISSICLRKKMKEAVSVKENIWQSDYVDSAFVFGVFRPRIYLSSSLKEEQLEYVIAHEQAHIARKDHWWKPLGFLLLTIYWFNPLIWVAYMILCKDIEYACDEYVIKNMQVEEKKAYTTALLECTTLRKMIYACPVAFGELNVEKRVKKVLNYKKPGIWLCFCAIVICIVLGVGFLTEPVLSNVKLEEKDFETYILLGKRDSLTLMPSNRFYMQHDDSNGVNRGAYEKAGNQLTLQFDDNKSISYTMRIEGDALVFENSQTANDFLTDAWNVVTTGGERFLKLSTYTLLERGWPKQFIEAMDDATKEKLAESGSRPASTYWTYYFYKNGNSKGVEYGTSVQYNEEEYVKNCVLKVNLMVVPVGHMNFGEGYYESELDGVNVFCTYEWLQPPSTLGNDYKMCLKWDDGYFEMKPNTFLKMDKYNTKDGEYVHSYEPGYASGGPSEVLWYTDIKGTLGIAPERLYGCGIVAMEKTKDISALNINFLLEYEVNGKVYQANEEFSWEPIRVEMD